MLYLGIDQHARQLTVSLRNERGDVVLAGQVSTEPDRIRTFFDQLARDRVARVHRLDQSPARSSAPSNGLRAMNPFGAGGDSLKPPPESLSHDVRPSRWPFSYARSRRAAGWRAKRTQFYIPTLVTTAQLHLGEISLWAAGPEDNLKRPSGAGPNPAVAIRQAGHGPRSRTPMRDTTEHTLGTSLPAVRYRIVLAIGRIA